MVSPHKSFEFRCNCGYLAVVMVTIITVNWIIEADAICARLEASGIPALIPDQGAVAINPLLANAVGGIRIQVEESDAERAREILRDDLKWAERGMFACPACQSDRVEYERVSKRFAYLSLLLLGFPLLWVRRVYTCKACGHSWKG